MGMCQGRIFRPGNIDPLNLFLSKRLKIDGLEENSALQSGYSNPFSAEVPSGNFTAGFQREPNQLRKAPIKGVFGRFAGMPNPDFPLFHYHLGSNDDVHEIAQEAA